ncbi:MAG TPA: alanine--tRNA ligase [Candidatus Binatus sp.]|uniref:alanine--tRNA ligase n=1 Tax=Candidatus Binatus sp. TaxID=2811406 RepID=UPI002B489755|nr:alanine--tRNA ligase [Candidatus Binatus sp.]HKN13127.1 alanine--tRNA ligase [Candidatus Binatus sp.]
MRWTTAKIRQSFLDFFAERGHTIVPSASLIPKGDPTLLFVNAGMVQFKDYFLGVRTPPQVRVADVQKCLRISGKHNDLEAVGRDTYHHTFFEMLGNWSFGDYYKEEAIRWHWELITKVWEIDPSLLYATVHKDDKEAEDIWIKLNVLPRERILRFGDKDNFWEMAETGPSGPNSEISIDRGEGACDPEKNHAGQKCFVNVDGCERFIEIGNLVFIQYNREASGALTPLPKKHVDTGSGLERIAAALQSLEAGKILGNYDIDLFQTIIKKIQIVAKEVGNARPYSKSEESDVSYRAIADHARAMTFLIAEGVTPGNTDREYVLRRIIRRAARHGRYLGIHRPFLAAAHAGVVEAMGDAYPEIKAAASKTAGVITQEESRFGETLDRGLELIDAELARIKKSSGHTLPGEVAFKLYDTYGFPLDLTEDVVRNHSIDVDVAGFNRLMDEQKERGRAARKDEAVASEISLGAGIASHFVGYHSYEGESEVLAVGGKDGEHVAIVVAETPFYPEGGGQVGDRGVIETASGAILEVSDTRKTEGSIVHVGRMLRGDAADFARGARVKLKVDRLRRDAAMLNHSATHILHYALRDVLGSSVHQAGSLVDPDKLRFDFAHQGPVKVDALATIEEEINARIRENAEVMVEEMAYDDAIKAGALAFFGDKYGDRVRVVRMGDFSVELCGGTHISRTGDVGMFKLEAESGVAAGVRRIEAVTGQGALETIRKREKILDEIGAQLGARDGAAIERLEKLLAREKELEKKLRAMEQKLASGAGGAADEEQVRDVGGVKVVTRRLDGVDPRTMREMADRMRQKHGSAVVALGSDLGDGRVALLVAVTPDLTSKIKAGDIIKNLAPIVGGNGGGRPDLAQAGGRDASKLDEALAKVAALVS